MFQSLSARILLLVTSVVLVAALSFILLIYLATDKTLDNIHEEYAINMLRTVRLNVETEFKSIKFHKKASLDQRKATLENITNIASTVVDNYYQEFKKGRISEKKAKKQAISAIKELRYDNGVGYLWINDIQRPVPKMIMHPTIPELDGTILDDKKFNCALGKKYNLFVAFVDVCLEKGSGFVDYLWPKPTQDGLTADQPKISYVSLYKNWNWVIGTGLYVDDIEAEEKKRYDAVIEELRYSLDPVRIAHAGYMVIFNGKKEMLVHPNMEGVNYSTARSPSTGNLILDDLIDASKHPNIPLEYSWNRPDQAKTDFSHVKKSYVTYFEQLDWYICSTFYIEDLEAPAVELAKKILFLSLFILLLASLIALILSRNLVRPLSKLSNSIGEIEQRGIVAANLPVSGTTETKQIGIMLNKMVLAIKESEKDLLKERDFIRGLFQIIPACIVAINQQGKVEMINRTMLTALGYKEEEVIGLDYLDTFVPEDEQPTLQTVFNNLATSEQTTISENNVFSKSGEKILMEWRGSQIISRKGEIEFFFGVGVDIRERKKAEEALLRSEKWLSTTLNSVGDAVITTETDGSISFMNPAAESLIGYNLKNLIGKQLFESVVLLNENTRMKIEDPILSIVEKGTSLELQNAILALKDGQEYPVLISGSPIVDAEQKVFGVVIIVRDMSETREKEAQLRHQQKLEAIGTLAGGVAHEINNPINIIMNYGQLIMDDVKDNEQVAQDAEAIVSESKRIGSIVKNLLAFSRHEQEGHSQARIIDIVDSTLSLTNKILSKDQIVIDYDVPDTLPVLKCRSQQIMQVLMNIITNARDALNDKYSGYDENKKVNIVATELDKNGIAYVRVSISDSGNGIPEEIRDRIFDPFFTSKPKDQGTGLGLSVSYGIVKEHKGELSIESTSGEGTTFHMDLPVPLSD